MIPRRDKFISGSLLAILMIAVIARAEKVPGTPLPAPAPAENAPGYRPANPNAELLQRFDKNRDGKLDESERAAARAAAMKQGLGDGRMRERVIKQFDRDGDGRLNAAEEAAARAALQKRRVGKKS